MKTISLLFLLLSSISINAQNHCSNKSFKNHLESQKLKGPVKQMRESYWSEKGKYHDTSDGSYKLEYSFAYQFNQYGNLIQKVQYRKDSSIADIESNTYDSLQRVNSHSNYSPERIAHQSTCSCRYNALGFPISELTTMYGGTVIINDTKISYDASGRLIKTLSILPRLKDTIIRKMKYDGKGRLKEVNFTEWIDKRRDWSKTTYTYDTAGRIKEEKIVYQNDQTITIYEYDQFGNIVKMQHLEGKSKYLSFTETTVYIYDSYNNWTKKTIHRIANEGYSYERIIERLIEYN